MPREEYGFRILWPLLHARIPRLLESWLSMGMPSPTLTEADL